MTKKINRVYIVAHRRRREGKTDYRARLALLKSGQPRLVVRKSTKNIVCQVVQYGPKGDTTVVSADSKQLKKLTGWNFGGGNIPSAYLTGLLCGHRAKAAKVSSCILDLGLYSSTKGSRIYAALKGVVDAGIKVPHSAEILPGNDSLSGKIIADFNEKFKDMPKEALDAKEKILKGK